MSNTYCPLAWNHFSTSSDGNMRLCCNSTVDGLFSTKIDKIHNVIDFYNIGQMKNIRKRMINGEKSTECSYCYAIEENGGESMRTIFKKQWPLENFINDTNKETGELTSVNINYLDLNWSNKCNLQCKMCSLPASDQLLDETKFLYYNILPSWADKEFKTHWEYDNIKSLLENPMLTKNLEQLLVTGGEPLINNDFYKFCQMLIATGISKQVSLSIHTNLTVTPSKWFNIWKHFKHMMIKISIDGIEEMYEYVRYPGKWKILKDNINEIVEFANASDNLYIEFHTVFSVFNTHQFVKLLDYISTLHGPKVLGIPHVNYVYNPAYASPSNLPTDYKIEIYNEINNWVLKNKITSEKSLEKIGVILSVINIMMKINPTPEEIQDSYKMIARMDQFRKHNTKDFLPWFKNIKI